ncbi:MULTISPECIES: ester cyclase [unclassified Microbacterium]|uniref:ester cyclase n=1 Tax=unclassified Microbacterium TaxID=2609290 RepID=UPI00214B98F7|nr:MULTISPECIES: ester cyclase [unclassified Microbacterium]MCR2783918.1 ester cyclase [Microbacterium sp. zg.B96]WIM15237.1 ester cyclase [Microbacterium sp. zg-B96]
MDATRIESAALQVVERMLHEGFATGNQDIVDELCSPDLIEHQFGLSGSGPEAIAKVKRGIADVHRAMPDLVFRVADWAEHDDIVWVRAEAEATNTGPFLGPATGRPVSFTVIDVARVRDGRIVEHWGVPDRFEILVRLGRVPQVAE